MKIKLAVFFGGKSVEHEISIISALQAIENLDAEKYEIFPIYITKSNEFYYSDNLRNIKNFKNINELQKISERVFLTKEGARVCLYSLERKKIKKSLISHIDVAFPIVHGTNVEDGSFQGFLNTLDLPFASPDTLESAVCMDKYIMKVMLKVGNFNVLPGLRFSRDNFLDFDKCKKIVKKAFSYPVIVKPINLGSSIGISKATNDDELDESFADAFTYSDFILVEPLIKNFREINCAVYGDKDNQYASELEEVIAGAEILSYNDKYLGDAKGLGGAKNGNGAKGGTSASAQRNEKLNRVSINDLTAEGDSAKGDKKSNNGKNKEVIVSSDTSGVKSGVKGDGSDGQANRIIPAELSEKVREEIKETSKRAFKFLNLNGVTRIDFLIDKDSGEIFINELNTIPGSLAFYLFEPLGIEYKTLLDEMIRNAIKKAKNKEELISSFETNILEIKSS